MGGTASTFNYETPRVGIIPISNLEFGTHETVLLKEDSVAEAEAHQSVCEKPHEKYIRVRDFTMEHLPEDHREPDLFELIKSMAGLTVRIRVSYQSREWVVHQNGASCSNPGLDNKRGSVNEYLLGSGRIADVYQDKMQQINCRCNECVHSTIKRETWIILVFTATHVVFDSSEAEKSVCQLYYDINDERFKRFHGVRRRWANDDGDLCILECVTCDKSLAQELRGKISEFNKLWESIALKWSDSNVQTENRLVAIVSHPHGMEKKISIGMLKNIKKGILNGRNGLCLHYDVSTCSGSSGAPVYLYGQDWFKIEYVHSGRLPSSNYSTFWCRTGGLVHT